METPNPKTIGIGTKETPKLKAEKCVVESVDTEPLTSGKGTKAVFSLKHPSKQELIKVSSAVVMRQRKGKKEIVSLGAWVNLDEDGLLAKDSTLAQVLKFYNASNLTEMTGKTVETEVGEDGYLAIKAY